MSRIHIIDSGIARRAAIFRKILDLGTHAEIYDSCTEFTEQHREEGLILVAYEDSRVLFKLLEEGKIELPVVVYAEDPDTSEVVEAVQAGALDFIQWPASLERFQEAKDRVEKNFSQRNRRFRKQARARGLVAKLSPREVEVLSGVVAGESNKRIAESLGISPRTVEIHRANMMRKLNASSTGDAVRVALYAGLDIDHELAA